MKINTIACLTALLIAPFAAGAKMTAAQSLKPTPAHQDESRLIAKIISQLHYKKSTLDDEFSRKILENYIDTLDGNKMYFLSQDILDFDVYKDRLDDDIRNGELEAAFTIFNRYNERVKSQSEFALSQLEKPFNFELEEKFIWDRSEQPWAMNQKELNETWRKKVKNDYLNLKLAGKDDEKIKETLHKRYQYIRDRSDDIKSEDIFQFFMNAYVSLVEPHTGYMAPRSSENFDINMSLSLEGIGAVLGVDGEYTTINSIVKGGPADLQGDLKVGDKILAVGQGREGSYEDVVGWRNDDVVQKIRGEKGTTVRLMVIRKDDAPDTEGIAINIVRDKVKLETQAAQYKILKVHDEQGEYKIGVIDLPTFYLDFDALQAGESDYRSTSRDVTRILNQMKKENVEGVIVDLRNNGGGSLFEAEQLTGLFIDKGPVVQIKDSFGKINVKRDKNPKIVWDGPLVVLVNRLSASASEIFAAALQDYGRALIVGEQTFGKGTVQNMMSLNDYNNNREYEFGQLKVTMAQFFRINGGSTQNRGVIPDIRFPETPGSERYGESEYKNALPWSSINPSHFSSFDDLSEEIPYLIKRYKAREKDNFEFDFVKQELDLYNKEKENTSVSLSMAERKKRTEESDERKNKRKEMRAAFAENENTQVGRVDVLFDSSLALESEKNVSLDEEDEADEEDAFVDYRLDESARILGDLVGLQQKKLLVQSKKDER